MKATGWMFVIAVGMARASGAALPPAAVVGVPEVLDAPSYIPAEERYVHIAGGFFSYFDRKFGTVTDGNDRCRGTVCIEIDGLQQDSRFGYQTEGFIIFRDDRGNLRSFALERLDYVRLPGSDVPAYRLAGQGGILVAMDCGRAPPSLVGELYVREGSGYECFTISIRGRSENEAECHLWRMIERVTTL